MVTSLTKIYKSSISRFLNLRRLLSTRFGLKSSFSSTTTRPELLCSEMNVDTMPLCSQRVMIAFMDESVLSYCAFYNVRFELCFRDRVFHTTTDSSQFERS